MLYAVSIALTLAISIGVAVTISLVAGTISLLYAFLAPVFCALFCALLLGVLDLFIRCMPHKVWAYDRRPFYVSKREAEVLRKLGVRKWKDKAVPELGASAGFSKKHLESTEVDYLARFLRETCQGEALHSSAGTLSFVFLALYPVKVWGAIFPILIVNFILNLLPCLIQRYNRYRLAIAYKFKTRERSDEKASEFVSDGGQGGGR